VAKTKDKPPATSKDSASDIRLKRNQAVENLDTLLFDDTSQEQRSWVTQAATWNEIVPRINAAISNAGVNPNRPIGIQLRKNAFQRLGVRTGTLGNPIGAMP